MKKIYILIGIIMLGFTTYEVATSYAKYASQGIATAEKQAGAWVIKINDKDISAKSSDKQFIIDQLTYHSNDYVLENKIAPSSSGYFDVIIDASGSSVAVKFDVTIDLTALNISRAINFESAYKVTDEQETDELVRTGENTYSGIVTLNDVESNKPTTVRFYIGWEDDETGQNDEADSRLGVLREISSLNLPVSVVISQYSGEQLVEYE